MPETESVRISRDTLQRVREVAEYENRPISSQIDLMLRKWLREWSPMLDLPAVAPRPASVDDALTGAAGGEGATT